jgi:hypothetical protein
MKVISWNNLTEASVIVNQELMFYEVDSPEYERLNEIAVKLNQLLKDYAVS